MDLPCDDATATFHEYAGVVIAALDGEAGDVVLVGHSLAGHTIPLVAALRPVARLVFLCALVPEPQRSSSELAARDNMILSHYKRGLNPPDGQGRRAWADENVAHSVLYGDCDDAVAHAAYERLRPQSSAPYGVPCPLNALPGVPRTSIICTDDRILDNAWSRRAARHLDADLIELPGSHSPFLSRPRDLAAVLLSF